LSKQFRRLGYLVFTASLFSVLEGAANLMLGAIHFNVGINNTTGFDLVGLGAILWCVLRFGLQAAVAGCSWMGMT
jgi:hypothetical protein